MRKAWVVSAGTVLVFGALLARVDRALEMPRWRTSHFENVLGTSMEIKVRSSTEAAARQAEDAAMAEIRRLNGILSGYDAASEFSRWARTRDQAVRVSGELWEVLQLWDLWSARTGGVLRPTAAAIGQVWKDAASGGRLPAEKELQPAVHMAAGAPWKLDAAAHTATRLGSAPLLLNSFTKSYIVDRAAQAAIHTVGVDGVVVNIGGDMAVRGAWADEVAVADPFADAENSAPLARMAVRDKAVATSGSYRRGYEIAGVHYSHLIDPRTGRTAEEILSATVVSPDAVTAGALATAMAIETPTVSRKLAAAVPGTEYLLVRRDGARVMSAGWNAMQVKAAASAPAATAVSAGSWDSSYELNIGVEIPQAQGFGARRPYAAVWIEDKDRFPVRTLGLWFNNTRWLPDLRAWYRADRMRSMAEGNEILNSVTSATRSPGKYSFKWDGKDNAGKLVKPGKYTVLVEAAREHGGYNLVKRELVLAGAPVQAQAAAEGELGAITMDYRKAGR